MMRPVAAILLLLAGSALLLPSASAGAAELRVLTPPVVEHAGLQELVAEFQQKTGTKVTLTVGEMLKIPERVKTEATDVFFLESDLMGQLAPGDMAKAPPPVEMGRVHIGLAVKAGAPHPDISTLPKFIAALKTAKGVT